jgi:hypothetical protein
MEDFTPPTQPSDDLVPPPKVPGTAIATSAPEPPRPPRHPRSLRDPNPIRRLLTGALDLVDDLADAVAGGLGLRHQ